jgi:putative transposase
MIDRNHALPIARQAELVGISRGNVYYLPRAVSAADQQLMKRIDALNLAHPFAGSRMLRDMLNREGFDVGRRHVGTLMQRMGIEALYRKPNTSKKHPTHKVYPYLLRELKIDRANQVWASDITYVPMACGWVYLCAIVDWASRKVLSHRVSISMDASFCVEALAEAFAKHGQPEIFNSDQGSQFTSDEFTRPLKDRGVAISMDGKGAWRDNIFVERLWRSIKYEEVVCYERDRSQVERKRCFTKDEGRPLEVGLQEQASNRLKLRRSRAVVVSVDGKGGAGLRQVRIKKTNASEPLMTCRNVLTEVETGIWISIPRARLGANLSTAQLASGIKAA